MAEEKKNQKKEADTGQKCSKCGSKMVYVRIKNEELVCRRCGNVDKLRKVSDGSSQS